MGVWCTHCKKWDNFVLELSNVCSKCVPSKSALKFHSNSCSNCRQSVQKFQILSSYLKKKKKGGGIIQCSLQKGVIG